MTANQNAPIGRRLHRHLHYPGIDQHLVVRNIVKLGCEFGRVIAPHDHRMSLRIGLGHDGQQLAW
jgi:hypothetical protein